MQRWKCPTHNPRTGFTLIELLIVVAIMAIAGVSLDAAIVQILRESAILERSMAMQSESAQTLEALTHDLGRARGPVSVVSLPPNPVPAFDPVADPETRIGKAPGSAEPILTLETPPSENTPDTTRIEYRLRDGVLRRHSVCGATSRTQTLAQSVESLTFQREGNRLAVDIRFASCPTTDRAEQRIRTEFYLGEAQP
ncbi:MAG TPA: prepilin-type N-terminal cleavage/methylation domain-containing protein [Candidatus Sumerlaeota bacterium]|nr:prepilin-type N-terminal cleavage/methylation domain-containing protein [Candidatus Sumerlaeota bacterium]